MDYTELSHQCLEAIYRFYKVESQQQFNQAMHGETFALQFIAKHHDFVVPKDIENEMDISSARVTTILNGLENKGLVTRQIDTVDRRRTILKLTSKGEEVVAKNTAHLLASVTEMLEYLGEEDAKHYVRLMDKLSDRCGRIKPLDLFNELDNK